MTSHNPLSLDFLAAKPVAAAKVLQTLESDIAAPYLEQVPIRILAPVVQAMENWPAARILDRLDVERNAAVFLQLNYRNVAALLRLQEESRRGQLLEILPAKLARPLARSLAYEENTVGAWMDISTPHFYPDLRVGDCLALLRKNAAPFGSSLMVVNRNHRLVGAVALDTLLTSPDDRTLDQLLDPGLEALAVEMSVQVARKASAWHRHGVLPVRSNSGTYLGTLSRLTLQQALLSNRTPQAPALGDSLLAQLARAMAETAGGLLKFSSNSAQHWQADHREHSHDR
jgi:Mg/Co/Ni transporter MgtE